ILRAGNVDETTPEAKKDQGLKEIILGGVIAGGFSLLSNGFKLAADSVSYWFSTGRAIFQLPLGFSFALVGAGYLVGITGGIAMLFGVFLSWGIAVPWLTLRKAGPGGASIIESATTIWASQVRRSGSG